ncbi:MAG: hypothetical protein ABEJ40_08020 [Haloarculaceae archaeon]
MFRYRTEERRERPRTHDSGGGDNLALDGDGTYEVTVEVGRVSARRTGAFADRLDETATATFSLPFEESTMDDISYERLPDKQGSPGAVGPMAMGDVPVAEAPAADALPGTPLGEGTSGDARFVATRMGTPPTGLGDGTAYLAVSPRTPYNRYPLPFMSLSATVTRDGSPVFDGTLSPTLDPDLGYHYGAAADVRAGDDVALSVGTPPQLARHEGYETAFFSFPDLTLSE